MPSGRAGVRASVRVRDRGRVRVRVRVTNRVSFELEVMVRVMIQIWEWGRTRVRIKDCWSLLLEFSPIYTRHEHRDNHTARYGGWGSRSEPQWPKLVYQRQV